MQKSIMFLDEAVDNKERKFGASDEYFPVRVVTEDGQTINALFTQDQLATAIQRALRNPEDIPENTTLWERIFK